jgi:hypothetical protein
MNGGRKHGQFFVVLVGLLNKGTENTESVNTEAFLLQRIH